MNDEDLPDFVVCCRLSDPDPACVFTMGSATGFCTKCGEPVRVSEDSIPHLFDGAALVCIQCVVELPGVIFSRSVNEQGFKDAIALRALLLGHDVTFGNEEDAERVFGYLREWLGDHG